MFKAWRIRRLERLLGNVLDGIDAVYTEISMAPRNTTARGPWYAPRLKKLYEKADKIEIKIAALMGRL